MSCYFCRCFFLQISSLMLRWLAGDSHALGFPPATVDHSSVSFHLTSQRSESVFCNVVPGDAHLIWKGIYKSVNINLYSPHGQHKTVNHKNNNQRKQTGSVQLSRCIVTANWQIWNQVTGQWFRSCRSHVIVTDQVSGSVFACILFLLFGQKNQRICQLVWLCVQYRICFQAHVLVNWYFYCLLLRFVTACWSFCLLICWVGSPGQKQQGRVESWVKDLNPVRSLLHSNRRLFNA